jgi:hypothetical protein
MSAAKSRSRRIVVFMCFLPGFSAMLALPAAAGQCDNGRCGETEGRIARSDRARRLAVGGAPGFTAEAERAE